MLAVIVARAIPLAGRVDLVVSEAVQGVRWRVDADEPRPIRLDEPRDPDAAESVSRSATDMVENAERLAAGRAAGADFDGSRNRHAPRPAGPDFKE